MFCFHSFVLQILKPQSSSSLHFPIYSLCNQQDAVGKEEVDQAVWVGRQEDKQGKASAAKHCAAEKGHEGDAVDVSKPTHEEGHHHLQEPSAGVF